MPYRLVKYSGIIFSATVAANLLAYLFHVYMGRSLGVVEYGILGSLLAAFYILFVPLGAISTVVTKFVSEFKAIKTFSHTTVPLLQPPYPTPGSPGCTFFLFLPFLPFHQNS